MTIWGLTGGIACGKSTVSAMLSAHGWGVIDTDLIAQELTEPGAENWQNIVDVFGGHVLNTDSSINRRLLGDLIFEDSQQREKLNAITHPAIRRAWSEARTRFVRDHPDQCLAIVVPLLFEKDLVAEFQRIACVGCSETTQRGRLARRGLSPEQTNARIGSQWPVAEKMKQADVVIWNEGHLTVLEKQLNLIFNREKQEHANAQ
jgi:dephospho-CoA kinase